MGLLDVINAMQNSRGGQRAPSSTTSSGGMSPMTMALLGLIAQRALKSFGGAQPNPIPAGGKPNVGPDGSVVAGMPGVGSGGGLGDLLKGQLGGLLAGGAAGGAPVPVLLAVLPSPCESQVHGSRFYAQAGWCLVRRRYSRNPTRSPPFRPSSNGSISRVPSELNRQQRRCQPGGNSPPQIRPASRTKAA
jgi:hypothetical protein